MRKEKKAEKKKALVDGWVDGWMDGCVLLEKLIEERSRKPLQDGNRFHSLVAPKSRCVAAKGEFSHRSSHRVNEANLDNGRPSFVQNLLCFFVYVSNGGME